jgi:alpha-tubulin suppressor-like RCC1 family protein
VTGATSYSVYYGTSPGVTKSSGVQISGITTTSTIITGLTNGVSYYFVVTTVGSGGESSESNEVSAMPQVNFPGAPANVSASAGDMSVSLSWDAITGATSYNIYYGTSSGVTTSTGAKIDGGSASSYTVTGLTNSTPYYFIVTAVNAGGESAASAQVGGTPHVPTPTGFVATAGNKQVSLSWDAVTGATSYNIYYGASSEVTTSTGASISGVTTTSYTVTGLSNYTQYYFIVTAVTSGGESSASNRISSNPAIVIAIAVGQYHTAALMSDGTVRAWGYNGGGELGDGTTTDSYSPVPVGGLSGVTAIACSAHTLALMSDGTARAWGYNTYGQLGNGTTTSSSTPVTVSGLSGATAIAAGAYHTVALNSDGTVRAWGYNAQGQLGDGTTANSSTPVQVSGLTAVTSIAAGFGHTVALTSDGTVWAWGENSYGELGDGTTTNSSTPVEVSGLTGVTAIAAGQYHTVAVKSDGTVWAWGSNAHGELGNGDLGFDSSSPVHASGLTGVTAIATAVNHTVALTSDGTVWAWGYNTWGQLGDGTNTTRDAPVQVSGATGVTAISAYDGTALLKNDGSVWASGYNAHGELGDGTTTDSYTPVQVKGL